MNKLSPFLPYLLRVGASLVALLTPAIGAIAAGVAVHPAMFAVGFLAAGTTYARWHPDASLARVLALLGAAPDGESAQGRTNP